MNPELLDALARTTLLIGLDVFGLEGAEAIATGLSSTTVAIVSDEPNASVSSAQTMIVSLADMLVRMGVAVVLDLPDVELRSAQPPLRPGRLRTSLERHMADAIPVAAGSGEPLFTVAVGSTKWEQGPGVRLTGDDWSFRLLPLGASASGWAGDWPFGGVAGAAAAAGEVLRVALPAIATNLGATLPSQPRWRFDAERSIDLDLAPRGTLLRADLGRVDFISAGAITNAAIYTLLRVPGFAVEGRVFDDGVLEVSNLNRYPLALQRDMGLPKAKVIAGLSNGRCTFEPVARMFDLKALAAGEQLAPRVAVGVDNIPSRWLVQAAAPGVVIVGGTTHDFVTVSTHAPGEACVGCAHPRDEGIDGDIPTISFVSMWAGLLQARALIENLSNGGPQPRSTWLHALSLRERTGIRDLPVQRHPNCPLQCSTGTRFTIDDARRLPGVSTIPLF